MKFSLLFIIFISGQKKKDSVQVSEVKIIRVGRSKNIFILDLFCYYTCTEVEIEDMYSCGGQLL